MPQDQHSTSTTSGCCGPATEQTATTTDHVTSDKAATAGGVTASATVPGPCCGTVDAAAAAGACCDPAAKAEAVDSGVGCCGPTTTATETRTAIAGEPQESDRPDELPVVVS